MFSSFEDRAKVFTNIVTKLPIDVVIQTTTNRITGKVHIRPDERFLDEVNQDKRFLPVTEAVVLNEQGDELYHSNFMVVNRGQILWIVPLEEIQNTEKHHDE
jgi:hypothetical protein